MLTLIIFQTKMVMYEKGIRKKVVNNEEQGTFRPEMSHLRKLDAFRGEKKREGKGYYNLFLP